jgi:hypothetical protein
MGAWKTVDSPRLKIPMEMREVTAAGPRAWEVQELRKGCMFKVTLAVSPRRLSDDAVERAVCVAVEEALLSPPDKEPGETYDVEVTEEHLEETQQVS